MEEGVVRLKPVLDSPDTRPLMKTLSELKNKIQQTFGGADAKELSASIKSVSAEIKATEKLAQKAQMALEALMSGEMVPKSIQNMRKELAATMSQLDKMAHGYDKMLAQVEKYQDYAGLNPKYHPQAQMYEDAKAALERYEREMASLEQKAQELDATLRTLEQNPELTPEAQQYNRILTDSGKRLTELRAKEEELGAQVEKNRALHELSSKSAVAGLQKIENRIVRLAKRVLFFSVITMALRNFRKYISALIKSDSALSVSLGQVKNALASSFGMIWASALPAIRTLIKWIAIAMKYLAAFISWLTGKSFKQGLKVFNSANDAAGGIADNTGKIGKAAKKAAKEAQRLLLPFDQMNVLTKDTAANAGGAGGGGGGAGGNIGDIEYPKDMDKIIAKFEKLKDLILLIGSAFAAWKLSKILSTLLGISRIKAFVGLTALIAGIALLVRGVRDLIKNGPSVENICDIIAGAFLTIGGAILLLTGATGLGLIVAAIGLVVLAFKNLYKNFKPFKKYIDDALKRIKKAFSKGKLKGFTQIGKEIILGILKGMLWVLKKIGSWIKKKVVEPVKKWFKKKFGISSPAKEMMDIGKNIMLGVLEGILQPIKTIGKWIKDNVLDPIKKALFGSSDEEEGEGFVVKIGAAFSDTKDSIKEKWDEITGDIKDKTVTLIAEAKEKAGSILDKIKEGWALAGSVTKELIANAKEKAGSILDKIKEGWALAVSTTKEFIADVKEKTAGFIDKVKDTWALATGQVRTFVADVKEKTAGVIDTIKSAWALATGQVRTFVADVKEKTSGFVDKVKAVWALATGQTRSLTANIAESAKGVLDKVLNVWSLGEKATKSLILNVADKTTKFVNNLKYIWKAKKKSLTLTLSGVKEKIINNIQKLKDAWTGWKGGEKSVSLTATLKAVASKAWNDAATKLNNAKKAHPTLLGWLPNLPTLAKGAVIPPNKEFLALLGDQKRGTNVETPLETMIQAFNAALQQNGYGGNQDINVYLQGDAKQLFRVVRVEADNYTRSTGKAAFNL